VDEIDVFSGTVLTVQRVLECTVVRCGDAAVALSAARPGVTFERQDARAIITALARAVDARTGRIDCDLELAAYVAHQGRTAWEHVTTLATWGGALATTAAAGTIEVRQFPHPPADLALRYGREIAALTVVTVPRFADVTIVGGGPAGNTSDPGVMLQTIAPLPQGAPGPDTNSIRIAAPALRTPAAVSSAIKAAAAWHGAARLVATCWLVPRLRAGTAVEIVDAPTPNSAGPWLITSVVHAVGPGPAGRTTFEAVAMDTAGTGLRDQLVGAVGGIR
jgi:hypothetical protein